MVMMYLNRDTYYIVLGIDVLFFRSFRIEYNTKNSSFVPIVLFFRHALHASTTYLDKG